MLFFNNRKLSLKYFFEVEYIDGSIFKQPSDDHSELDKNRSSFYDVLESKKEIKTFKVGGLKVDLETGLFELDGRKLQLSENIIPSKRQLIFFRQHQHDFNSKNGKETSHRVKYFVGWQTKIKSKNVKYLLGIE